MARRHRRVLIDLGTGDGRAVLAECAADEDLLVIGVDADARAMADASRRALRGRPASIASRAWFVAGGVEDLPAELAGLADRVTVRFPWGSLLRGALGLDGRGAHAITRLVAPGGRLELTVSVVGRDGPSVTGLAGDLGPDDLARIAAAYGSLGFDLDELRPLSEADLAGLHSSWARRLGVVRQRPAWRVTLVRRPAAVVQ